MPRPLTGISSMATRQLLAELAQAYERAGGAPVHFESVGGVDAAKRVAAGEVFDLVVLADDALERLLAGGHVVAGSRRDLVRSEVVAAVRAGAARPAIDTEAALRAAVQAAASIGYSTGPSGNALLQLIERWGLGDALRARLRQAPPGVPVGTLVARGEVELGFQQRSELMQLPGITVLGALPEPCAIVTIFSAGVGARAAQPDAARALIDFLCAPAAADLKRRHGMTPA